MCLDYLHTLSDNQVTWIFAYSQRFEVDDEDTISGCSCELRYPFITDPNSNIAFGVGWLWTNCNEVVFNVDTNNGSLETMRTRKEEGFMIPRLLSSMVPGDTRRIDVYTTNPQRSTCRASLEVWIIGNFQY